MIRIMQSISTIHTIHSNTSRIFCFVVQVNIFHIFLHSLSLRLSHYSSVVRFCSGGQWRRCMKHRRKRRKNLNFSGSTLINQTNGMRIEKEWAILFMYADERQTMVSFHFRLFTFERHSNGSRQGYSKLDENENEEIRRSNKSRVEKRNRERGKRYDLIIVLTWLKTRIWCMRGESVRALCSCGRWLWRQHGLLIIQGLFQLFFFSHVIVIITRCVSFILSMPWSLRLFKFNVSICISNTHPLWRLIEKESPLKVNKSVEKPRTEKRAARKILWLKWVMTFHLFID